MDCRRIWAAALKRTRHSKAFWVGYYTDRDGVPCAVRAEDFAALRFDTEQLALKAAAQHQQEKDI